MHGPFTPPAGASRSRANTKEHAMTRYIPIYVDGRELDFIDAWPGIEGGWEG